MDELTEANYPIIQGLVLGLAHKICQTTGKDLKQSYPSALSEAANFLSVTPGALEEYLSAQRLRFRVAKFNESKLLLKSEKLNSVKEQKRILEESLMRNLKDVPPGMGKKLTFADAEVATQARKMLACVTRALWNTVERGGKQFSYEAKQTGRVLEVWRLA